MPVDVLREIEFRAAMPALVAGMLLDAPVHFFPSRR